MGERRRSGGSNTPIIIAAVIGALAAAGVGGYLYVRKQAEQREMRRRIAQKKAEDKERAEAAARAKAEAEAKAKTEAEAKARAEAEAKARAEAEARAREEAARREEEKMRAEAAARASSAVPAGDRVEIVESFENDASLRLFESKKGTAALSTEHATHGNGCLRVEGGDYLVTFRLRKNWKGFDSFDIDMYYDAAGPASCYVLIGDDAWRSTKGGTYWNRHNGSFSLKPGANVVSFPVEGLYRGEAGSRNNDIKRNIDPDSIVRLDLGFKSAAGVIYIDNMRLIKSSRPEGIHAFDFGPESQVMEPGFAAMTWNTNHGGARKYGWHARRHPWGKNSARDDTFPTKLYQDFVEASGSEFVLDLPGGNYHVFVVFDDLGYWGGEHAKHRRRTIKAEGVLKHDDDRGEAGPLEYLYHFEDTEIHPGDDPWEKHMGFLFEPVRFSIDVTDGALNLQFDADAGFSCKVAALVVYPDSKRAECEAWVGRVVEKQREEFVKKAFERPTPAGGQVAELPASVRDKGYAVFVPDISREVYLTAVPKPDELGSSISIAAARGEYEVATFAVRPLRDLGKVRVELDSLSGPGGARIAGDDIDVRWVWHCGKRGFGTVNYRITPWSLRAMPAEGLDLPKDLTRQFWMTIRAPEDARAGSYKGTARVQGDGIDEKIEVALKVRPFKLDGPSPAEGLRPAGGTEFAMGFFGSRAPGVYQGEKRDAVQLELFKLLKRHGMNQVAGPPGITLNGFDAAGKPQLDFSATDTYMRLAREAGFMEVSGYGGMAVLGLHSRYNYVVGEEGEKWAKQLGVPYVEVCRRVFDEVKKHADAQNWLPFDYPLCDETRVREHAEKQVVLMKALRDAAPWLRTTGGYSVSFRTADDPMLHQEFFRLLRVSYLNSHDQTVIDKAKEIGAEVRIYNQGRDRFTFGWYQWSEYQKGVTGRTQWHLLALHGYQWFDLDGREPDTAMINYGREEVIPTIALARCREGADDFYYCQTLHNLMERAEKKGGRAAQVARDEGAFLKETTDRIGLNKRGCPDWLNQDEYREKLAAAIEKIRAALGE